jgi:hypothetical protein
VRESIDRLVALGDRSEAAYGLLCLEVALNHRGSADEAKATLRKSTEFVEAAHDARRLA